MFTANKIQNRKNNNNIKVKVLLPWNTSIENCIEFSTKDIVSIPIVLFVSVNWETALDYNEQILHENL